MTNLEALIPADDPWIETLSSGPIPGERRCVLHWVQRAKRAATNRAANVAVGIADALGLPVVAVFALDPAYPDATLRPYQFMLEGMEELPQAFNDRGIGWALRIGNPERLIPEVVDELAAAVLVTDQDFLRTARAWRASIASRLPIPFLAVDSDTIAPTALFPREQYAARTLRPKLWRAIANGGFLDPLPDPKPRTRNQLSALRQGPSPLEALAAIGADGSVPPSPRFRGGSSEARARLDRFVSNRLPTYPENRNRPETVTQSELSPYLHFGQISPLEIARAAIDARVGSRSWLTPKGHTRIANGRGHPAEDAPLMDFLDELITQRELAINFCLCNPDYDRWDVLPEWGRQTLRKHQPDPRPYRYAHATIENGETDDRLWNAAQRQLRHDGWMPNRLRMYWAKQMLYWRADPEDAHALAVSLMDRYFVDSRDANGFTGIAWAIGGRHDRPFAERDILGLIRPMGAKGMARAMDVPAYIRSIEALSGESVPPLEPELQIGLGV